METFSGPEYDLAIIGAGFSGSMVAIHVLAAARGSLTVALINKNADFGRGIAYGTRNPAHLLNVPAARMSAFVDDPDDFYRWLEEHRELCEAFGVGAARKDQFIPRALFGRYVSELLERQADAAPLGVVLKKIVADVQDMQECRGGMRVWLDADESLTARKVVLAPGNFPPGDPSLRASGTVVEVPHPKLGSYLTIGSPIKFSDMQVDVKASPLLGEHTDEVLSGLGYSQQQIEELHQAKAV